VPAFLKVWSVFFFFRFCSSSSLESEFYGLINLLDALLGSRFYRTETLFPVLNVPEEICFTAEFDDYGLEKRKRRMVFF
jgi:hypothetical protein